MSLEVLKSEQKLRPYKDPQCSNPLTRITFDEPITVGETAEKVIYVKNVSPEELDHIEIETDNPEIKIEQSSNALSQGESMSIKIIATPSKLKVLTVNLKCRARAIARGYT